MGESDRPFQVEGEGGDIDGGIDVDVVEGEGGDESDEEREEEKRQSPGGKGGHDGGGYEGRREEWNGVWAGAAIQRRCDGGGVSYAVWATAGHFPAQVRLSAIRFVSPPLELSREEGDTRWAVMGPSADHQQCGLVRAFQCPALACLSSPSPLSVVSAQPKDWR